MTKSHLVTAAAALSLGISGTLVGAGYTAEASVPYPNTVTVSSVFPNANPAVAAVWDKIDQAMCAKAETEGGLDAGDCAVEEGTTVEMTRGASRTAVTVHFKFAGTWVKSP